MNIVMNVQYPMFCLLYCFSGDELDLWYQSNTKSCINGFNTNWIGCKKNVSNTFLLNELYSYWLMWTGFDLFLMICLSLYMKTNYSYCMIIGLPAAKFLNKSSERLIWRVLSMKNGVWSNRKIQLLNIFHSTR